MISYHVFFTPKAGVDDQQIIDSAHRFFRQLQAEKKLRSYRIMHVTNPASFQGLLRYQAIVDYETQQELDESFAFMHQGLRISDGAHGELMRMVGDFKVSFTADV